MSTTNAVNPISASSANATWMMIAPRSRFARVNIFMSVIPTDGERGTGLLSALCRAAALTSRGGISDWRVHESRSLHALSDAALGHESLEFRRQRWHFVRVQRPHEARSDQHHELGLCGPFRLGLEQIPDHGDLAEERDRRGVVLRHVVEKSCDGEGLAITQLHIRLRTPGGQSRDPEAAERDAVGEVERADLGHHLESNHV